MKTSISHLPESRQEQINKIIEVIKDFVDPEKIILYGSRASGKEKEDSYVKNGIRYYYTSDYDIAVITNKTDLKGYELDEVLNNMNINPDINAQMYDIAFFNSLLQNGEYFYVTIYEDGILVYDKGEFELVEPKPLSMEQVHMNAQKYYDYWFSRIKIFFNSAQNLRNQPNATEAEITMASWFLYQVIEGLYSVILLVFTGNKPKLHNLYKYRNSVRGFSKELDSIFPFPTKDKYEYNLFDLIKRAYIGAKYKEEYEITIEEVNDINSRIIEMMKITETICSERINSYKA